eukprot:15339766-Ditylum_brightwellii.AAC.2
MDQFLLGNVFFLLANMTNVLSHSHSDTISTCKASDDIPIAAAMSLANTGNISGALKRILQDTLIATVTKRTHNKLYHYYPQEGADSKSTVVYHPATNTSGLFLNYPTARLRKHIRKIKRGKGASPYTDITDILCNLALTDDDSLATVWHYLLLFGNNVVPSIIREEYAA